MNQKVGPAISVLRAWIFSLELYPSSIYIEGKEIIILQSTKESN